MKTIIEMARKAGLVFNEEHGTDTARSLHLGRVQAFAELVAAAEREACAKVCEGLRDEANTNNARLWLTASAELIRARGNT